jgi:hypothetical protein
MKWKRREKKVQYIGRMADTVAGRGLHAGGKPATIFLFFFFLFIFSL